MARTSAKSQLEKEQPITQVEANQQSEVEILREQNKALQEQMAKQMEMMSNLMANQSNKSEHKDETTRKVKIIHLQQPSPGMETPIRLSRISFSFTRYGEERFLRFDDFLELTGERFKDYWKEHILALSAEDEDLIEEYDLTSIDDVALTSYHIKNLPNLPVEELETIVKNLSLNHKLLISRTWASGYYAGENSAFADRRKIEILNDITEGGMENILSELDAQRKRK